MVKIVQKLVNSLFKQLKQYLKTSSFRKPMTAHSSGLPNTILIWWKGLQCQIWRVWLNYD